MKKKIIIGLLCFLPFVKVNAISCNDKNVIDISTVGNFTCSDIKGDKLTFKDSTSDEDYTKYFTYSIDEGKALITPDKSLKFDGSFPNRYITVSDGTGTSRINVKDGAYVPPTTTKPTTTTADPNVKEITVTLDTNDGKEKTTKTCKIVSPNTTCSVTLPKLDTTGFNGWGTASTCKEGNIGSTKVDKDTTYYACYETNETQDTNLLLKTLKITDKDTNKEINFGTFSIKKTKYRFKVLNEVKNLNIEATSDDGIKIDIKGNEDLQEGENDITITLTSSDNKTNTYKLTVTRLKEGETITSIHYLKSLVIGGYPITFTKNQFNYTITIANDIDKLQIDPVVETDSDTFEILNNNNLENGSIIKINVTGDDKLVTTYNINIIKESKSNLFLYIGIGIVALLTILLIILIILKSNNKKKNNKIGPKTLDNKKDNIEVLNI